LNYDIKKKIHKKNTIKWFESKRVNSKNTLSKSWDCDNFIKKIKQIIKSNS
jgi:hypothetical protein